MSVYEFGPFRLDAERLSLTENGHAVALGRRVVETLLALVERAGQTAEKNELMERVWPEGFVEEGNLTQNIYVLRRALRSAGLSGAIETVPRIGYRFTAPVRCVRDVPASQMRPAFGRRIAAALCAAILAAASLVLMMNHGAGQRDEPGSRLSQRAARLYAIGRYYWGLRTSDGVRRSLAYFQQVVDADPQSARGYAALADANEAMGDYCYGTHVPPVYFARAREYANKALALDPNSAEAHASIGFLALDRNDVHTALAEFRRAIVLEPSYATAHEWYGIALLGNGRAESGLHQLKIAQTLDPLSVVTTAWLSSAAYQSGRFAQAVLYARETLELAPQRIDALRILGESYEAQGKVEQAISVFKQYRAIDEYYRPDAAVLLARAYALDRRMAQAREELAFARAHVAALQHRLGVENAGRLLLRGSSTFGFIAAGGFLRPDPYGLNIDELVYSET